MARALPSGTVTLLFTDIEGSTKLVHELGDDYAKALSHHRRAVREAVSARGGVEVDTQGDAFFVAFTSAAEAVAAAVDAQQALADGPVRVRMGLHTGEPRLTDEGYVGLDVHRGARIAAVGHGGQVLLSQSTRALVDAPVRDLGAHRLKDLSVAERIYQVEIEGLPSDFPLLNTMDAGMSTLPAASTSFVGRSAELDEIERMLGKPECRLLTLVGPGGIGKTRLALEAAGRRVDRYQHGVHFVPLASVVSPDFVAPAVADAIQFAADTAHSGIEAREQLLDYLAERSTLLVLDNFEHLVDGSTLLADVIERAPRVELLATSRERLNLKSEWVLDVEGLAATTNGNGGGAALRLFVDRSAQVRAGFTLSEEEQHDARRICRLVGGMPLGIELAASWVSTLSCGEIADEIERNLDFLATSMRDVPERHRSLRAAIDHSWRLLTDARRATLARLSVFRGSFDRTAARAVADADLGTLSELVAKSLVRRTDFGRFELHELLRQYGADRLAEAPDQLSAAQERHARHYAALMLDRHEALVGPSLATARDELRGEISNLRAAAEWFIQHGERNETLDVLAALYRFMWHHGEFDGAETLERLADMADFARTAPDTASDIALSAAAYWVSMATGLGYDASIEELGKRCVPLLRERAMERELGVCLLALGIIAVYIDVYSDAVTRLQESVDLARAQGDGLTQVASLSWLGFAQLLMDDLDAARSTFKTSLEVSRHYGSPLLEAYSLSKLGIHADAERRYADALRLHLEANTMFESVGDEGGTGYTLSRASMSAYGLGDYGAALRYGRAGHGAFSDVNNSWGVTTALCRIGFPALALGDYDDAARRFGDALERAHGAQAISLELLAMSGVGALMEQRGDGAPAATLLCYVLGHDHLPSAYGFLARPALDRLESSLPREGLEAVRAAAASASHAEMIESARQAVARQLRGAATSPSRPGGVATDQVPGA